MVPRQRLRALLGAALVFILIFVAGQLIAFAKKAQDPQVAKGIVANPQVSPSAKYVGSDVCKTCHEDRFKEIADSPHWNSVLKVNGTEAHSCETCHGPGSEHVDAGGDKSKIYSFKGKRADEVSRRCLQCHTFTTEHGNFLRSPHVKANVGCTTCHSPHHAVVKASLLTDESPTLCYRCHAEVKSDFAKPFRHRVNEKLITCNDCHSPHGGLVMSRSLRTTPGQEQVCFTCHRDKQGPFLFEHVPVKTEGCVSCHTPHGSTNPRLLRVYPVNVLCMQCHTTTTNSGVPAIPSFHNQAQKYQSCTMCHPMIHGSNGAETFEY
jgi:DmsE family decaheme c-type cytochrome